MFQPMKASATFHKMVSALIAAVWFANGLVKIFNLVPRHELIVARILGSEYAYMLTKAIGIAEIAMVIWILSGIKTRLNIITQIIIISAMNILEFIFTPDLLLWGKFNAFFAFFFILLIYNNGISRKKIAPQT